MRQHLQTKNKLIFVNKNKKGKFFTTSKINLTLIYTLYLNDSIKQRLRKLKAYFYKIKILKLLLFN